MSFQDELVGLPVADHDHNVRATRDPAPRAGGLGSDPRLGLHFERPGLPLPWSLGSAPMDRSLEPVHEAVALFDLIERNELVWFVGLLYAARAADNGRHTALAK